MSEDVYNCIVVFPAVFIGIFTWIFVSLRIKSKKKNFIDKAIKEGCVVKGEHVKHITFYGTNDPNDESYHRNDTYRVKYKYEVDGKVYYKKLKFQEDFPMTITVYYKKNNPRKCITNEEMETEYAIGCITGFVVCFVIVRLLAYLLQGFVK